MAGMEGLRAPVTGGAAGIGLAPESERAAIVSSCRHWTMFGSEWPACLMDASYEQVVDVAQILLAGLSKDERTDALGATAARWYELERR